MPRYTEAILDLAFRQGFERKRQRETEARRTQRQERIGQLLGQVQTQPQQQGPTISGAPLGAQPATGAVAELATYGVNLPSQYTAPLVDVSKVPVPEEVKEAYNNRVITFQQLYQFRDKRVRMSDDEMKFLWENDERVQAAFPNGWEQMKATQSFFGAFGKELGADVFGAEKPSALSERLTNIRSFLTDPTTGQTRRWEDLKNDPLTLGQLDAVGLTFDDVAQIYGWDPGRFGKIEETVRREIISGNAGLKFRFNEYLEKWKQGEQIVDDPERNQQYSDLFTRYYDRNSGEIKPSILIAKADFLDNVAARAMGMEAAVEIPENIRPTVVWLSENGIKSAADIDEEIKKAEEAGLPESEWFYSREQLEEAKKYFGE